MIEKTKVLIVDDSAMIREFLRSVIGGEPDMEVIGTAVDPIFAREKILSLRPDVITLDIEMPRMDGLTFLQKIMAAHPVPVVMFSKVTQAGAEASLQALRLGAVEVIAKPTHNLQDNLPNLKMEILSKIRAAARAKIRLFSPIPPGPLSSSRGSGEADVSWSMPQASGDMVVVMGASTGGTVALEKVLCSLPPDSPPLAVVQHLPAQFTGPFAQRLNQNAAIEISQAEDFMPLKPGQAVVAPGDRHLFLEKNHQGYYVRAKGGPMVNHHRPSVDVLFRSTAGSAPGMALGVIMTGMGGDGARGALEMRRQGCQVLAQDEASSVIYGMARAAVEMGAVERILPLEQIGPAICRLWKTVRRKQAP
ncbi:MAG: chemotaxis response regulator protein-glutamate methylesterase [Desulfarculaceae bacterium]|nr:chemotaxis response regulator protein-glutamate methylesterase [Desulfarculaceae bacterium]MCF8047252.1 chemotaxis response regulator protein-glutamate methylesterase [Desulfarculaceae bacterium]MCF8065769.1 chemotaxis response regulator protein-glutamate methylesterase [Desulfarculaceae bacterium]MCF8097803.1 chemotaxis response regulator protein-glutamate methylesterase [Desulfarculaceae bacterium]MCF8122340.1 chemotaxis response regulator protein-glutamate methylesterase [Desulfarculaceae